MAQVKSFSVADGEQSTYKEFKQLCKDRKPKISVSWALMSLMAKAVQGNKEGKGFII